MGKWFNLLHCNTDPKLEMILMKDSKLLLTLISHCFAILNSGYVASPVQGMALPSSIVPARVTRLSFQPLVSFTFLEAKQPFFKPLSFLSMICSV